MHSTRLTHYLYTASLFLLILLTAIAIAISAADVIIQALADRTESDELDYRNLVVVAASYVVLAIAALSFSCSRVLTVRASLQDIPKIYIPIKEDDLPKKVYAHIKRKFENARNVRKAAEPLAEDIGQLGRAKPGSENFEGVDFKRAIARTPIIIEQAAIEINGVYARPLYLSVRQYIDYLIENNIIDGQLGQGYLEGYEQARFNRTPVSQEKYYDIMKHLAAILHNMGYRLHAATPGAGGGGGDGDDRHTTHSEGESGSGDDDDDGLSNSSSQRTHGRSTDPAATTATTATTNTKTEPRDDDVVSLAQSVATWTSRSTLSHRRRANLTRHTSEEDNNSYDDNDFDQYDQHMRRAIYSRLMWDRAVDPS